MSRSVSVAAAILLGCGGGSKPAPPTQPVRPDPIPAGDWPQFRRDVAGTSSTPYAPAVPPPLAEAWSVPVGASVYGQPVAAAGVAYVTSALDGRVAAVSLADGTVRWSRSLDAPVHADCKGTSHPGIWGAAAVDGDAVYAASPDGGVYALDAASGSVRWRAEVTRPSPDGALIESSVVVSHALGRAYVGVASTAHCDQIQGAIAAIDLASHAVTVLKLVPDGQRGGSVWDSAAVDEDAGLVFVGTGNACGDPACETADPAAEPLAQAIVALDARTLEVRAAWQNPTPLLNADFGGSPTLFTAGGRRLLAATSKDGNLYVLDRDRLAAGPVWPARLAVVDPAQPGVGGDPLKGFGSIVSPTLVGGLLVAAGGRTPAGDPGAVTAFDPATGAVRWTHPTPGFVLRAVAAAGGVLFATSTHPDQGATTLEALDAATGARLASVDRSGPSFAAVSAASGLLLWPTAEGALVAYPLPPSARGARPGAR